MVEGNNWQLVTVEEPKEVLAPGGGDVGPNVGGEVINRSVVVDPAVVGSISEDSQLVTHSPVVLLGGVGLDYLQRLGEGELLTHDNRRQVVDQVQVRALLGEGGDDGDVWLVRMREQCWEGVLSGRGPY
jgi:hypothetical protein